MYRKSCISVGLGNERDILFEDFPEIGACVLRGCLVPLCITRSMPSLVAREANTHKNHLQNVLSEDEKEIAEKKGIATLVIKRNIKKTLTFENTRSRPRFLEAPAWPATPLAACLPKLPSRRLTLPYERGRVFCALQLGPQARCRSACRRSRTTQSAAASALSCSRTGQSRTTA